MESGEKRRGRTRRGPKPVKVGDIVEVEVVGKSKRGDGVAKIEGFVVFVPGTEPGQKVRVRIERVGNTYAVGKVLT
ncbi:MAG: TRAM domain-containing protein [Thermoproteaceae archaeon]|jgi:predicted RNA-binding protein with TRAM domain|nr:TRAM domain-containing protein [Thermoproteaceae archaeon]